MEREIDLQEISDGRLYDAGDMVRVGCNDCEGCSACCRGMENTIILDPYDMWQFAVGPGISFEQLLADGKIELNVVDGAVLPNLKLAGAGESCTFLNTDGRCSIHQYRPGICRLFPLGRIYENHSFRYFLQVNECVKEKRTKVKVKQWIGIPELKKYETFICDWHYFLRDWQKEMLNMQEESRTEHSMKLLKLFYLVPWNPDADFFEQFYRRMRMIRKG